MESLKEYKSTREWAGETSEITPWLYLSGARAVKPEILNKFGITLIINATQELPELSIDNVEVINIPISDSHTTLIKPMLYLVADKIETARQSGGKVLVHCIAGVSRSPSLVLAYLIKYFQLSLRQAFQRVKEIRPIIRPNSNFIAQLIHFEKEIRGETSVDLISTENGRVPDIVGPEEIRLMQRSLWTDIITPRLTLLKHFS